MANNLQFGVTAGALVELFQQAESKIRRAGATIMLLAYAASEQQLMPEWEDALALLQEELASARDLQRKIKGVVLSTPTRHETAA